MTIFQSQVQVDNGELQPRRFKVVDGVLIWMDPMPTRWERENWDQTEAVSSSSYEAGKLGL